MSSECFSFVFLFMLFFTQYKYLIDSWWIFWIDNKRIILYFFSMATKYQTFSCTREDNKNAMHFIGFYESLIIHLEKERKNRKKCNHFVIKVLQRFAIRFIKIYTKKICSVIIAAFQSISFFLRFSHWNNRDRNYRLVSHHVILY